MMRRLILSLILSICCLLPATEEDFIRIDFPPFYIETDVGIDDKEKKKTAVRMAKLLGKNLKHFQSLFKLKMKDFEEFDRFYGADAQPPRFQKGIRIRIWKNFDEFLGDLQHRYDTKARAAGFHGIGYPERDSEGNTSGIMWREIGLHMDGISEMQAMRVLYHEFGHLFMKTYIKMPVEVPSWLEEGNAQLLQYRPGNGTKPETERLERFAFLYEMTSSEEEDFVTFPNLTEITKVRNAHNLDFTHQNPLRSIAQYTMVWGLAEFLIEDPKAFKAYKKMLEEFRDRSYDHFQKTRGKPKREYLYGIQDEVMMKSFGATFEEIEGFWKKWIKKRYEKFAKKSPEILFHRALYHFNMRARFAPTEEWRQKAITKAQSLLDDLETKYPEEVLPDVGRAIIASRLGDWDKAMKLYISARERGSKRLEVLIYGANAMIRQGRAEEVVEDLEYALKEAPGNGLAMGQLGLAYLITGQEYEKAAGLLRASYLDDPSNHQLATYEGLALHLSGEDEKAFYAFAKSFQNQQQKDWLSAALIVALAQKGNIGQDPYDWIPRVRTSNPELGEKLAAAYDAKQNLQIAFNNKGDLGLVGINIEAEGAIIPSPEEKRRGLFKKRKKK